jgi:site-specific recombinase XerD
MAKRSTPGPSLKRMRTSFEIHIRPLARQTRRAYLMAVDSLATYLDANDFPSGIREIRPVHIAAYFGSLSDRGLKPSTRHQFHRSLTTFWKWAVSQDDGPAVSPMVTLKAPRVPKTTQATVTQDDFDKLVRSVSGRSFASVRDRAIFSLLYSGGLRRAELTGIKLADIDLHEGVCKVTGKGGHDRLVPFSGSTAQRIDEYLRARETWVSQRGRQARYGHLQALWLGEMGALTIYGVSQAIDRRLRTAGLQHLSAHAFRRGWAVKAVQAGINESLIMRAAGWKTRAMIGTYTEAAEAALAIEAFRNKMRD